MCFKTFLLNRVLMIQSGIYNEDKILPLMVPPFQEGQLIGAEAAFCCENRVGFGQSVNADHKKTCCIWSSHLRYLSVDVLSLLVSVYSSLVILSAPLLQ